MVDAFAVEDTWLSTLSQRRRKYPPMHSHSFVVSALAALLPDLAATAFRSETTPVTVAATNLPASNARHKSTHRLPATMLAARFPSLAARVQAMMVNPYVPIMGETTWWWKLV